MDFTILIAVQVAVAVIALYGSKFVKRYIDSYRVYQKIKRYPGMDGAWQVRELDRCATIFSSSICSLTLSRGTRAMSSTLPSVIFPALTAPHYVLACTSIQRRDSAYMP